MNAPIILFVLLTMFIKPAEITTGLKAEPETSFKFLLEKSSAGFSLSSEKGCSWKTLSFSLNTGKSQAFDENGMVNLSDPEDANAQRNFLIIVSSANYKVNLRSLKGTTWQELNYSCTNEKCGEWIDEEGLAD